MSILLQHSIASGGSVASYENGTEWEDPPNTNYTIDSSGLTLERSNVGSWSSNQSILSKSSGKWYWEITLDQRVGSPSHIYGAAEDRVANGVIYPGNNASGWGYDSIGRKWHNGSNSAYGTAISVGQTLGIALNLDDNEIYFSVEGSWQGGSDPSAGTSPAFTGVSGTLFANAATFPNATNPILTANFGSTALQFTVPTGYSAGLF